MLDIEPHLIGLPRNEFNKHIDALLETGRMNPEILEFMNARQMDICNEIKKALKRITSRMT